MATYVFAMPIQPGKLELLRKYTQEMNGPRREEFHKRNQKLGLEAVQVWIQHTPNGDLALVRWEADDPRRIFEQIAKSDDPFEKWFREKMVSEVFGRNPSDGPPPINEQIVHYQGQKTSQREYQEMGRQ